MWGNALGWCISAVMVVATAVGVIWLEHNMDSVSGRTEFSLRQEDGGVIALPVPPLTVLPGMTDEIDAGPIYRAAVEQYQRDPVTYGRFARSGRERDIEEIQPGVRVVLQARTARHAILFAGNPSEIVNYNAERPALEALTVLGACARRAGQLIEKKDPAEAMHLYEAAFALGARLYEERLTWAELDSGLTLMAEAATLIGSRAQSSGDLSRAEACRKFNEARQSYVRQRLAPMQRVLTSADQAVLEEHAGDVFYYARHAEERVWRVEAILKLGRYRFNAGRVGDQRAAMRVLPELAEEIDPAIRAAAVAARDLTEAQYRMLR